MEPLASAKGYPGSFQDNGKLRKENQMRNLE